MKFEQKRYDDVHLKKFENAYLAKAILNMIFFNGGYYRKELVDAEFWSK